MDKYWTISHIIPIETGVILKCRHENNVILLLKEFNFCLYIPAIYNGKLSDINLKKKVQLNKFRSLRYKGKGYNRFNKYYFKTLRDYKTAIYLLKDKIPKLAPSYNFSIETGYKVDDNIKFEGLRCSSFKDIDCKKYEVYKVTSMEKVEEDKKHFSILCYDFETYCKEDRVPQPETDISFMISIVYQTPSEVVRAVFVNTQGRCKCNFCF